MRAVEVGGGALTGISSHLMSAAEDLDGLGSGAPKTVDAGPWSSVISVMLAQVTAGAAGAAEAIGTASNAVGDSAASYANADDAAHTHLTQRRP